MYHQLRRAVTPHIPLNVAIRQWPVISQELSEMRRRRTYQTARLTRTLEAIA